MVETDQLRRLAEEDPFSPRSEALVQAADHIDDLQSKLVRLTLRAPADSASRAVADADGKASLSAAADALLRNAQAFRANARTAYANGSPEELRVSVGAVSENIAGLLEELARISG